MSLVLRARAAIALEETPWPRWCQSRPSSSSGRRALVRPSLLPRQRSIRPRGCLREHVGYRAALPSGPGVSGGIRAARLEALSSPTRCAPHDAPAGGAPTASSSAIARSRGRKHVGSPIRDLDSPAAPRSKLPARRTPRSAGPQTMRRAGPRAVAYVNIILREAAPAAGSSRRPGAGRRRGGPPGA